jgi:hypothetical protein
VIVQFLRDTITPDGKNRVKGEVGNFNETLAQALIQAGVAKERPPIDKPPETKTPETKKKGKP